MMIIIMIKSVSNIDCIDYTLNSKCTYYSDFLENNCEVLQNYYANSCYYNILMDTYGRTMNKYENNKNITGQELAQILNKRYTDRDFGL